YDAACELMLAEDEGIADDVIIPIVAECDDSFLSDPRRMQVSADDVRTALDMARAPAGGRQAPAQGAVRAGARGERPGLQGRHRQGVPGRAVRAHRGCARAGELR